ncbi:hypothetical protein [Granulicella sibirica]|uniref:Uncharacterized protein n=1 Tax=Granulicella sibirica TaxID=2479048 RepID=A0A4Q0T7Q1_9BACT|nr:hypothetical protein [Granulicella sibirica]RXH57631.1 hypothetical protein GRAN_0941 [Granulicella sibirica]
MRVRPTLLALAFSSSLAIAQTIPEAHCTSLAGTTVNLPADLQGRTTILVLGFSRDSQQSVTTWGRRLAADFATSTTVSFYELAMLESVPRIMRGLVLRSMKKDVSERNQPHLLPITDNEPLWRNLAHYDKPEDAYVLLVAPDGAILWQAAGPPTDAAYADLRKHLP